MRIIKCLLFVAALFIASNTYAQHLLSENGQKDNLRVGLFYSLDTNLSGDIKLDDETGYRTQYNGNNFTTGLNLRYSLIKNMAFQSGVSYSNRDFSGTYYCNLCDFLIPPQQEEINLQFLQVPAALKYSNIFNNLGLFGKIGILNQLLVKESNEFYKLETNSYSLSGILGAGLEYNFGYGFSTALSANYTNGLTQIFKDADYSYKTFGIQLHLSIEL